MRKILYLLAVVGVWMVAGCSRAPEKALDVRVNVAEWLNTHADGANTNRFAALGISDFSATVQVDRGEVVLAARIETTLPDAKTVWLNQTNTVQLEAVSDNEFKLILTDAEDETTLPILDDLHLRFSGGSVLISDADHFEVAEGLDVAPMGNTLLEGTVQLSVLFEPVCRAVAEFIDTQEDGFGKAMIVGVWDSICSQLEELDDMPVTTVNIVSAAPDARRMSLGFVYQKASDAKGMQLFFKDPENAWKDPAITDRQLSMMELIETPYFKGSEIDGDTVCFSYEWQASEDAELLEIAGQAMFGGISWMYGTDFPLNSKQTMNAPVLVNVDAVDAEVIEATIRGALFFNHKWSQSLSYEVDYLDVVNADLVEASIANVSVVSSNGTEVASSNQRAGFSYNEESRSASISLPIEAGSDPATASFQSNLEIPAGFEKHTLSLNNPVFETAQGGCCLMALSNSVVEIRSKDLSFQDVKFYVRDEMGDYLQSRGRSWSESFFRGEYKGVPVTVDVVIPLNKETVAIGFKDLPAVELSMPDNPTSDVITRYSMERPELFSDPDMAAFSAECMTLVTNSGWRKNQWQLAFPKPEGVKVKSVEMRTYLAGTDQMVFRGGGYTYSLGAQFFWSLGNTKPLQSAGGIFGEITAEFWSGTGCYTVDLDPENPVPLIDGQELPSVSVEHNAV